MLAQIHPQIKLGTDINMINIAKVNAVIRLFIIHRPYLDLTSWAGYAKIELEEAHSSVLNRD
jgi:hypothetical protein